MMAHKHLLHQLLKEEQEPFQLKNYIADRRCQLKNLSSKTTLQPKKRKPNHRQYFNSSTVATTTSTTKRSSSSSFCKHACFLSFQNSPDVRKSPFLDLHSPAKSPLHNNNTVFLNIPARTAALLLEAAMRIQKQQSSSKPKSQMTKNAGFGLFGIGSILKKLKDRNRNKKKEIQFNNRSSDKVVVKLEDGGISNVRISCSCNHSRRSSVGWSSESNEEKSTETSTSGCSRSGEDSDEIDQFVLLKRSPSQKSFCSSPSSPFRFSLQRSPSYTGRRTPEFSSPASSPHSHRNQEKENYAEQRFEEIQIEEEDEKEQSSPVSVLDPPFEDEDDGNEVAEEDDGGDDYDLDGSYAIVQRVKQQLLYKLRRFEKLAELDPVELEKRMMEEEPEDGGGAEYEEREDTLVNEVIGKSGLGECKKVGRGMRTLVEDLIAEEKGDGAIVCMDDNAVVKRVCKRLDSWKQVESNTIDMMFELDFRREIKGWMKNQEQVAEAAEQMEFAIFELLVTELVDELVQ